MSAIGYKNKIYPQGSSAAKNSVFDNTGTDLESTNAEDAIKEVDGKVDELESDLHHHVLVASGSGSTDLLSALDAMNTADLMCCILQSNNYCLKMMWSNDNQYLFNEMDTGSSAYAAEMRMTYVRSTSVEYNQFRSDTTTSETITIGNWAIYI